MNVRNATPADAEAIWGILEPMIRGGDTYALPQDMTREAAIAYWLGPDRETFILEEANSGETLGTYYLRANQLGGGAHVANCGYVTAPAASGRGVARTMCQHSLEVAQSRGFQAMQFNFVVSTNERAVRLWKKLGFNIVGVLPNAFLHPRDGAVDVYVMYRTL